MTPASYRMVRHVLFHSQTQNMQRHGGKFFGC